MLKVGQLATETDEGKAIIAKLDTANAHVRRSRKITDIQRDKAIYNNISRREDGTEDPRFKSSILPQYFRAYEIQAEHLPNTYPIREGASQVELSAISSIKDTIHEDSMLSSVYLDLIRNNFRTEGPGILELGFSADGNTIPVRSCQFANFYTDYDKDTLAYDAMDTNDLHAHWAAHKVPINRKQFEKMFPKFKGKVLAGDPVGITPASSTNETVNNTVIDDKDTIWTVWYYNDLDEEKVVIAGGNKRICDVVQGDAYPYRIKRRRLKKPVAFLPFVDFHYTMTGAEGICTPSQVGVVADIVRVDEDILTHGTDVVVKSVNPILAVFGGGEQGVKGSGKMREIFENAWKLQRLGKSEIVPLDEQARVDSIAPDPSIIGNLAAAQRLVYSQMAARTGFDPNLATQQEMKATVFIGKTKAEIQAINALYRLNRDKFNMMEERLIALAAHYWAKDEREVNIVVNEDRGQEHAMSISTLLPTLKEWDGRFETDVDLKMPLSTGEKENALGVLTAEKTRIFWNVNWTSVDQIMTEIDALVGRARLAGLEDYFKKSRLLEEAKSVEMTRNPEQVGEADDTARLMEGGDVPKDVREELSPNTALAQE